MKPSVLARPIEEGIAAATATAAANPRRRAAPERFEVIVIGAGQAGLAVGHHLTRAGAHFTILDENARVGDSWRNRWDSLRLFTPAKLDGLDGFRFPAPRNSYPTKDEMASYLEAYAERFRLPVRNGVRVERLFRRGGRFAISAGAQEFEAEHVVVAMSNYQRAKLPAFASGLASDIVRMHSSDYRNLSQLRSGGVLLVGAGNSGAEIALETARAGHATWVAGPSTGHLPFRTESFIGRNLLAPLMLRFVFHHLLTVRTPLGRRARRGALSGAVPLIRTKPWELAEAGVQRVPRVVGVHDGRPLLKDGRTLDVANVIWCSGFQPGFDWIDLPVFDRDGRPRHEAGVVSGETGLYFIGLAFLYSMSSSMIHGVSRDAARIAQLIGSRLAAKPVPGAPRQEGATA